MLFLSFFAAVALQSRSCYPVASTDARAVVGPEKKPWFIGHHPCPGEFL
ncbi:hypothetical protein SAMN06265355_101248 [Actinomadura mexicana]|uniref:Uncharacterized protein n=1 Tax=Actinomadura mexicana TaxID=134959 RepID=A0A238UR83_9ACTN|nr:hypothetical protein SAMN06265355_101248 [Actinomadura mexicana]